MSNFIDNEFKESKKYNLTKTGNLVDLTVDNVAKVEAMIRTDSNYKKSLERNAAPVWTKPRNKGKKPEIKYGGSSAYWIDQFDKEVVNGTIDKNDQKYTEIIEEIVKAIDRENSTHLNSDGCGIKELSGRIAKYNKTDLLGLLRNPSPDYKLIEELSKCTNPKGKSAKGRLYKGRENFSFATKFCHYMAFYLFENDPEADNFSIYDGVLEKAVKKYGPKKGGTFKNNKYKDYIDYIDDIRNQAKNNGQDISRNGLDHLLWYYYKGE